MKFSLIKYSWHKNIQMEEGEPFYEKVFRSNALVICE